MRLLAPLALVAALWCGGCATTPWVRGEIRDGMPKHDEKFPADMAFFVEKTEKRVQRGFEDAIRARGFVVAERREDCDMLVKTTVNAWEYNDMGFGGRGGSRDDMELSVSIVDRRRDRVVARANISVRSDFRIIRKYVDRW